MASGLLAAGFGGTVKLPPHLLAALVPLLTLAAVYVIFGLGEPVLTKYLNKIVNHAGGAQKLRISNLLIGSLPAAAMVEGMLCAACYLAFAVALSALAASVIKNTLGAVGLTVVALALPVAALAHPIQNWLPSALVDAPFGQIGGTHLTHYRPAIGTALVAAALLLIAAAARLRSREV